MIALKTLIFTILVPGTAAFVLPWLLAFAALFTGTAVSILLAPRFPSSPARCVALSLVCGSLHRSLGKGTPAPIDAPIFLVKVGPYQWVRNPMYLAVLAMVIGQAILFRSFLLLGYALLVWGVVHLFVVFVEECSLRRQFGESYETYLHTVPRWLPRFLKTRMCQHDH
jgi:protein-S-isoprenylcysteine O-methyltransferase Ste14